MVDSDRPTSIGEPRTQVEQPDPSSNALFAAPARIWRDTIRTVLAILIGFVLVPWLVHNFNGVVWVLLGSGP